VLHWSTAEPQSYRVEAAAEDSAVVDMIEPYREVLWSEMNEEIGRCTQPLVKERPEGTLCDWVADVMKMEAEKFSASPVDLAIANYGGIRINTLPAGAVTLGRIYEVMPFDNALVILDMTGAQLQDLLNHIAADGGWPISKELRFRIDNGAAVDVTVRGLSLESTRTYRVALPDYIANGGDRLDMLRELPRESLSYLVRDALITHVRNLTAAGQSIVVEKDGRLQ